MPAFPGPQGYGANTSLCTHGFDGISGLIGKIQDRIHPNLLS